VPAVARRADRSLRRRGPDHAYEWSVAIAQGGKSQVKAAGTVGAPAQGEATVSKSVTAMRGTGPSLEGWCWSAGIECTIRANGYDDACDSSSA
jgi:hypothetical protein